MSKKYVYLFSEGNANMRELLGGKGANLAEMTNIGLPVPQGFTITIHLRIFYPSAVGTALNFWSSRYMQYTALLMRRLT